MVSDENILQAYLAARLGKKHYREVAAIDADINHRLGELKELLLSGSFRTSEYTTIEKMSGSKLREIKKLPFFPDRIVHHCIVQVMRETWINLLIRDTFSTIPGRGIHDGANRVKLALRDKENTRYCLKLDIRKYYPSVDNRMLKEVIRRKIKDERFLAVIDEIIDSSPGIPIGNYVSQWFGNLYLAYFDHYVKEQLKCRYYFRYCDDLVLLSASKEELRGWLAQIRQYLKSELNLEIKSNYQIFPVEKRGIDFLGYRFFPGFTLVRKRIVKEMKRKLASPKSMASYWGWLKHADSYRLTLKYFGHERKFKQTA